MVLINIITIGSSNAIGHEELDTLGSDTLDSELDTGILLVLIVI